MAIKHLGTEISSDYDILKQRWLLDEISGDKMPEKPGLCLFKNTAKAIKMLNRHIQKPNSRIAMSTDVDMDGIGCTYILDRELNALGIKTRIPIINKEKVHGIKEKYAHYFNQNPIDLLIITDSSSNDVDIIKMFNCDVLCIDHHELNHNELQGKTNDGHDYLIVNNTIDNDSIEEDLKFVRGLNLEAFKNIETTYKGDDRMSCGLVLYELLRILNIIYGQDKLLENLMLYQWVGVTLFTDAIDLKTKRNQWYVRNTVMSKYREKTLGDIMKVLNQFKYNTTTGIDKTYIGYTFAPVFNKAIRAGASAEALQIVLRSPDKVLDLKKYEVMQKEAIDKAIYIFNEAYEKGSEQYENSKVRKEFNDTYIMYDITNDGTLPSYNGVIAGKMVSEFNKNSTSFKRCENSDIVVGSFRGRLQGIDYRKHFLDEIGENTSDIFAAGHKGAFGFRLHYDTLKKIMSTINSIEPITENKEYLTIGNVDQDKQGVYHIDNVLDFKRQGYLWRISIGNALVNSQDNIDLIVSSKDVVMKKAEEKVITYDVLGMECKAFQTLHGNLFRVYMEYNKEIGFYISNM